MSRLIFFDTPTERVVTHERHFNVLAGFGIECHPYVNALSIDGKSINELPRDVIGEITNWFYERKQFFNLMFSSREMYDYVTSNTFFGCENVTFKQKEKSIVKIGNDYIFESKLTSFNDITSTIKTLSEIKNNPHVIKFLSNRKKNLQSLLLNLYNPHYFIKNYVTDNPYDFIIEKLPNLKGFQKLSTWSYPLEERNIISKMKKLVKYTSKYKPISDIKEYDKNLLHLQNINYFSINTDIISPFTKLNSLKKITHLKYFMNSLSGNYIQSVDLSQKIKTQIFQLKNLEKLVICFPNFKVSCFTKKDFSKLEKLTKLKTLGITVKSNGFQNIPEFKKLEHLYIDSYNEIVKLIPLNLINLKTLNLRNKDTVLLENSFDKIYNLQKVHFRSENFMLNSNFKFLKILSISKNNKIDDFQINQLHLLSYIDLPSNTKISNNGIKDLKLLKAIFLNSNTKISVRGLKPLKLLKVLGLQSNENFTETNINDLKLKNLNHVLTSHYELNWPELLEGFKKKFKTLEPFLLDSINRFPVNW